MVLLDTNVISELVKKTVNINVQSWLDSIPVHQVFTSAISKAEIEYGIAILPDGKNKSQIAELADKVLSLFGDRILPFSSDSTPAFADIKSSRKKIGRPISYADAQIAAIAFHHGFHLATRNTMDFQAIEGLKLINPWNP
ncbi:MAG: type II toxin-antitoxin system VapC family toxin [Proteobacteria bacterium]|nr:type II toxin-antitoxin system VapC family toxin [Pseudomonadota bacterium]